MKQRTLMVCLAAGSLLPAASLFAADPLTERVNRIERQVSQVSTMTLDVQALKRENQLLRGQLEEQAHQIQRLQRKLQDMYLDLDQRVSGSQPAAPATAIPPVEPSASEAAPVPTEPVSAPPASVVIAPPPAAAGEDGQAAYDAAYQLLNPDQRRYQEAIKAFDQFLKDYPGSTLSDNALYWKAEASYVTGDNETAYAGFNQLVQQYPDSAKVPGAMLKMGYILHAQGKVSEARAVLSDVTRNYPASSASDMAQQRLDRISREGR
ncbi:MAG: tol-pal system protein YbgF [bacterium]